MHHHSASCVHDSISTSQPSQTNNKVRLLVTALFLIFSFSLAELAVGLFSHSLALLADAGHMLSDSLALILALLATWIASRGMTTKSSTEGNHWLELLAALINGIILLAIAFWISREAIERLQSPSLEIMSLPMLATATVGFVVNSINIFLLHKDSHHDLNLRGAFLHVIADAASSIGVILAAIAVWTMNWTWADGIISLLVSALIIISAVPLILQSLKALSQYSKPKKELSYSPVQEFHHGDSDQLEDNIL